MNLAKLSWKYIVDRPLNTVLNVILFGFGISIILVLLLVSFQVKDTLTKNAKGVNLVVAAKGSPLQIILCNIYHIDFPTGNISLEEAVKLSQNRLIKNSIPMALGDSYKDFRLVGTTRAYIDLYAGEVADGTQWQSAGEVVLGVNVSKQLDLSLGDEFYTEHGMQAGGLAHEEHPMKVVGVLERSGTVLDNLILTNVETIWAVHDTHEEEDHAEHDHDHAGHDHSHDLPEMREELGITFPADEFSEKEITSLIVQYAGPMAAVRLPRMINEKTNMQSASPAFETTRLFSLIGVGVELVNGFAYLIIFIAALSIFIALYNSIKQRAYDLAIMRAMGASKRFLFLHVIVESLIISVLGGIFGLLIAHLSVAAIDKFFIPLESQMHLSSLVFLQDEFIVIGISFVVGIIASVIPAISAYRTDLSNTLAKG
ncbi:MAG: FtsX-like permease family protein [Cyclobacteriaceae bacterium]